MKGAIGVLEKNRILPWLIVILIATLIFYTSSLPAPVKIKMQPSYVTVVYHIIVFFILSFFLLIAFRVQKNIAFLFVAIIVAVFYGIMDEFHQFFVPGRACAFSDLMLDMVGIFFSTLLYIIFINNSKARTNKAKKAKNLKTPDISKSKIKREKW